MNSYSAKTMEHFQNPRNLGKVKGANGIGKVGNLVCGDIMWLYIRVQDQRIEEIGVETFGCVAALATSSVVTELAKGKTISQALKIDKDQVIKVLGSLPPIKIHCSLLAIDALSEAIYDYFKKTKQPVPQKLKAAHRRILQEKKLLEQKFGTI
ncbi:iron-sulfur cluster assembly scaffold protein [Patescibacteria group bacterium]|nr:iron-sulfur cluster assembly scaffold protein [Patescibacteria group bacterium]MBU1931870.1 iron-sulfur cluster assembly scaffold protein [Patescibacteria group bacterium]